MSRAQTGKEVFGDAIELPPAQREEFVHRACGLDAALLAEVRELLRAHGAAPGFLAMPTLGGRQAGQVLEGPGSEIGKYRLVERVGEGGFGVVFIAEQREPVARRVALKVIKPGMDTAAVVARFEAERQALAVMDHPNIAKVLDAGATQSGRPYFVMELVAGRPITEFCDEHRLSIRERLELFTQVCRAVQHAHLKGVIHRDLNPRNILVSDQDGLPLARVIDFGIAKAVQRGLAEHSVFTEQGQIIGTPEYMSPEQAAGGPDVDTRADVYSLGVLLYELLTGSTPFDARSLRSAALDELRRIIREDEPPRPSTRLSAPRQALSSVAAQRGVDAARLGTIVRGELDWIVLKSLEKDRSRRYDSPGGLAADVERYLTGRPVSAAPPGAWYRVRKYAWRHRVGVTAGGIIVAALVVGLGTALWQASVAAGQRDAARASAVEAQKAHAQADQRRNEVEQIAEFQASQLKGINVALMGSGLHDEVLADARASMERAQIPADQIRARQEQLAQLLGDVNMTNVALHALDRDILARAVTAAGEKFADQPLVEARLLLTLGATLTELGLYDRAEGPVARGLAIRRRVLGDDDPETLHALSSMGMLLRLRGRLDEAERVYGESLERGRRLLGEDNPDVLADTNNLCVVLVSQGRLAQAEQCFREVLAKRRRLLGEDDPALIASVANLGAVLQKQGRLAEAEVYLSEALEKRRRVFGDDDPGTLRAMNNMGALLLDRGNLSGAEPLLRTALEKRRHVLGEDHPETIESMVTVASCLSTLGSPAEAERLLRDAVERSRRHLSEDHPVTTSAMRRLGQFLYRQGRSTEAEPVLIGAIERGRRTLAGDHPETLQSILTLADLRRNQGEFTAAEPLYREALTGMERQFGPEDHLSAAARAGLGAMLAAGGAYQEGERLLLQVEPVLKKGRRIEPNRYSTCVKDLAALYEMWDSAEPGKGHDAAAKIWKARSLSE
jgi:eukaryotic-like serine/threonine-protein kinase